MEYSHNAFCVVLSAASQTLRLAGITRIWIDTSGAGWTECFTVYIEATTTNTKPVNLHRLEADGTKIPTGEVIDYAFISDATAKTVETILAVFDLGDHLTWRFDPSEHYDNISNDTLVWPAIEKRKAVETKIKTLQAEVAELKKLEK